VQSRVPSAVDAIGQVDAGAPVYRTGTIGRSQTAEAQFWALEHPSTPGYASRYGIPQENVDNADFIEQGQVVGPFITRPAPGIGDNVGGGIEVVTDPGGVDLNWFSTQ
jgi:hypothetical protein